MGGWKTWAAVIGLCVLGMAMIVLGLSTPEARDVLIGLGVQTILLGLGFIGIGHKVEKNAAANIARLIVTAQDNKESQS